MNCRLVPVEERLRFRMSSFSHGSIPASTSCGFNFCRSFPLKTASTVQRSAPVRIRDLSARSPSKSCSAPMMIDFPAPVSPVTATNPGPSCHSSSSTSARFLIRNSVRTADIRESDQSHARNPRLQISPSNSAFALFDELDDFGDLFGLRQFFLHRFDCLASVVIGAVNQAERFFDQLNAFRRVILPFQTNKINAANLGRVAVRDHERWNILDNFRATAGDGESSDPAKLMYSCETAHHDVVSNSAIVSDMTVREKISGVADPRLAFARRATVHGHEFAEGVFVADLQI